MELSSTEMNTRVRGSPAPGISPNLRFGPSPLRDRGEYLWMCLSGVALGGLYQPLLLNISILVQDLMRSHNTPQGVSLPKEAVRREARRV
jgi:hypothetical protein